MVANFLKFKFILVLCYILLPLNAFAADFNGQQLYDKIVKTLSEQGFYSDPSVDFKKIYPDCDKELIINSLFGSWKTVQISCNGNKNWKMAVRTNANTSNVFHRSTLRKTDDSLIQIVALKNNLGKNEVLQLEDLVLVNPKRNLGRDIFFDPRTLVGRKIKSALSSGTIIKTRHLKPDWIIEKNQHVDIEHKVGNIMIKALGIAEENGQKGEKIWISNLNSGKKLLGWVETGKKVRTYTKMN